jgi:arylsulfatase A-like enzyme
MHPESTMHLWLRWCLAVACALAFSTPAGARNYLVVIVDDLGVDKVSAYQEDYTADVEHVAQMDAVQSLADSGVRFTSAWASPLCSPTRVSLLTGVHPVRHGIGQNVEPTEAGIDPVAWDMLGVTFADYGYETAFFGKWQIGHEDADGMIGFPAENRYFAMPHPARCGFDCFDGSLLGASAGGGYTDWDRLTWSSAYGFGEAWTEAEHHTAVFTESAIDWVAAREVGEPWLAIVAYTAPHAANQVLGGWGYADTDPTCYRDPVLACLASESCDDEAQSVYQGLAECLDLNLEMLLASIPDAVLDDTTVVFIGDNGTPGGLLEGAWDTASRGKGTSFESGIRVPFVIADGATWRTGAAGVIASPGRTSSATVQTIDLYATLLDDAFALAPAYEDSRSIVPCLSDTGDDCGWGDQPGYTEVFDHDSTGLLISGLAAARIGTSKMRFGYDTIGECLQVRRYELSTDPFEQTPLSVVGPESDALRDVFTAIQSDAVGWADAIPFCP